MSRLSEIETLSAAIDTGGVTLEGDLLIPHDATGLVAFAHGSGSSRFSTRNRFVADYLNHAGLATLLMDLLTKQEDAIDRQTAALRFDIAMLGTRLSGAVDWLASQDRVAHLPVGLFGASTGAAAALITAAERPQVRAAVSRGGRPDLARSALPRVRCPVLLIVGGDDTQVIGMNRDAAAQLTTEHRIEIVPGASHLFEEPGKLEQVAKLATDFFRDKLTAEG